MLLYFAITVKYKWSKVDSTKIPAFPFSFRTARTRFRAYVRSVCNILREHHLADVFRRRKEYPHHIMILLWHALKIRKLGNLPDID